MGADSRPDRDDAQDGAQNGPAPEELQEPTPNEPGDVVSEEVSGSEEDPGAADVPDPEEVSGSAADPGSEKDPVSEKLPDDLRLTTGMLAALRAVGATYLRRLWPLLVVVAVPVLPVAVLAQLVSLRPALDLVLANGVPQPLGTPGIEEWVLLGAVVILALLLTPLAVGGAVLVGGGALLGRRVPVPAAWRQALRRHLTVLTWMLLVLVWTTAVLATLYAALYVLEAPAWMLISVLVPLALYSLPMLVMALPVSLLEGHGPFRALVASWRIGLGRRLRYLLFVGLAFGTVYLMVQGLGLLTVWVVGPSVSPLLTVAAAVLVATLLAPLLPLLVSAPVVWDGVSVADPEFRHPKAKDLDLVAADRQLPQGAPEVEPAPRGRALAAVALSALAVFLPAATMPAVLAASDTPQVFTSPVEAIDDDEAVLSLAAVDDRAVITVSRGNIKVTVCHPRCESEGESSDMSGGGSTLVTDTGFIQAYWSDPDLSDRYDHVGQYLRDCAGFDPDTCAEEAGPGAELRSFERGFVETYSAIAPLEDGLVIASHIGRNSTGASETDQGGLHVNVCADTACAQTPHSVDLPDDIRVGVRHRKGALLDVAVSPEGGFAVSAYDGNHGGLTVVHCPDTECAEPEVTEVVAASIVGVDPFSYSSHPIHDYLGSRFGARVEYRPDGTPVLAYRAAKSGAAHVVDCHDAACTEFTDRAVSGPGWARPTPGLALDSAGNPQLATFDMAAEQVVLVSCLDGGCAETVTVPLRPLRDEPTMTVLTLDEADRPHLVWSQGNGDDGYDHDDFEASGEYVRCLEVRCGADGREPDPAGGAVGAQTP